MEYCQQNKQEMEGDYKTVFECRPQGKDFKWFVVVQRFKGDETLRLNNISVVSLRKVWKLCLN